MAPPTDFSQGGGFDVGEGGVNFVVEGGKKWLLGIGEVIDRYNFFH